MIPRLLQRGDRMVPSEAWPPVEGAGGELYAGRTPYRHLVVMVDDDQLCEHDYSTPLTKAELLSNLLQHQHVKTYRYADDGPPEGTLLVPEGSLGPFARPVYEDWAVISHSDPARELWTVTYVSAPGVIHNSGVIGNAVTIAGSDYGSCAYPDRAPDLAAMQRSADVLAGQVASQGLHADLFVTERPYLLENGRRFIRDTTVVTVDEAIAVVGLYLRAQNAYCIASNFSFNKGLFYWVGARELLPAGWRWFSACVQHDAGEGTSELTRLGGSLLQRVARALELRDQVHLSLNRRQNNDTQDDALGALESALLFLMGALDACALVAARVLDLKLKDRQVAWQNEEFMRAVGSQVAELAGCVEPGSDGAAVLTIVRLMRNSIHGVALDGIAVATASTVESLVGLPPGQEEQLARAIDRRGGMARWGAQAATDDRVYLDPGQFIDELFARTIDLLDKLMLATPVERLAHVSLDVTSSGPPSGPGEEVFDEFSRASIRWQLGF